MSLVWHYTTMTHAERIFVSGRLDPEFTVTPDGARPLVWFSAEPYWEPSACMSCDVKDGNRRWLTMLETGEIDGGLARFGVPAWDLTPWPKLAKIAEFTPVEVRSIIRIGRSKGADPKKWLGAIEPIPLARCVVQVMCRHDLQWHSAE